MKNQIRDAENSHKTEMEKLQNIFQKQKNNMEIEHRQKIEDKMRNARETALKGKHY